MMVKNMYSINDSEEHVCYMQWLRTCTVYMMVENMYSVNDSEEHVHFI